MNYSIIINNETVNLPDYTFGIADKIETQENLNAGSAKFRDKCKGMYDLICTLIGKDETEKHIGKFNDADPNTVNIVYLEIIKAYNKPLNDYNIDENQSKFSDALSAIDGEQVSKISELMKAINTVNKMQVVK